MLFRSFPVTISGGRCLPVNKFHDYFTSCLPYPQRGPAVTLPMEGNAAVNLFDSTDLKKKMTPSNSIYLNGTGSVAPEIYNEVGTVSDPKAAHVVGASTSQGTTPKSGYLGADLSSVTAATINDLRKAVAVQQYYEALARGGNVS